MFRVLTIVCLLVVSGVTFAHGFDHLNRLSQQQFEDLSGDLGAVLQPKQLMSAEPEGITGFAIGVDAAYTQVAHEKTWYQATDTAGLSGIPVVRLRVSKGLPAGFDIGAYYATTPASKHVQAYGFEARYAILEGSAVTPALGIRGTYNQLSGAGHISFHTMSLGLSLSKGFGPFTPYVGVGHIWVSSEAQAAAGLHSVSLGENHLFAGIDIGFGFGDLVFEWSRINDNTTYSAKLSFGL